MRMPHESLVTSVYVQKGMLEINKLNKMLYELNDYKAFSHNGNIYLVGKEKPIETPWTTQQFNIYMYF